LPVYRRASGRLGNPAEPGPFSPCAPLTPDVRNYEPGGAPLTSDVPNWTYLVRGEGDAAGAGDGVGTAVTR
jgi:hypothetical protein